MCYLQVDLPHGSQPRAEHSLTAITLGEGLTETISFGGVCKRPENVKIEADFDPYLIAETTLMRFGKPFSVHQGTCVYSRSSIATMWCTLDYILMVHGRAHIYITQRTLCVEELH